MSVLTADEQAMASGERGEGAAMAMRIVAESRAADGRAEADPHRLRPYRWRALSRRFRHALRGSAGRGRREGRRPGNAERWRARSDRLLASGCRAACARHGPAHDARLSIDGLRATWTCAPYQAGHRPATGTDVAWGEFNAVVFCNSVLGARTNRYGDFLDIACADRRRRARLWPAPDGEPPRDGGLRRRLRLPDALRRSDISGRSSAASMALSSAIGHRRDRPACRLPGEDPLKAFGAAAASSGAVGAVPCGRRHAGSAGPCHCLGGALAPEASS